MEIQHIAAAGSMESSDIMITIEENNEGKIEIFLESPVKSQFGIIIQDLIRGIAIELGVKSAKINAVDHGALDYTITARTTSAILRACNVDDYNPWENWQ